MACVHIVGMGIVSALGVGIEQTLASLKTNTPGILPLTRFVPAGHDPLPVGEAPVKQDGDKTLPRTLQLARIAADQAMENCKGPLDAIVVGVTTGGMAETERHLMAGENNPALYRHHAISSVAKDLSDRFRCSGPAITVSTACSSGGAAIKLAKEMIQKGLAQRVLAGGADALCRLTYYGFKSLQLIDPKGARPLDADRNGMSVAEGAGMLLLEKAGADKSAACLLGAGLSCDAWHPAKPHPEGKGAVAAMDLALDDAGVDASEIDYINLHGTGTIDNDLSEAVAIGRVFEPSLPLVSSVKGATGHSLAASGAIEAVISALCIQNAFAPANAGCATVDPKIRLNPIAEPKSTDITTVLSNAFGFGGNNAALVIGKPCFASKIPAGKIPEKLAIKGWSAITGAGDLDRTWANLDDNAPCRGKAPDADIGKELPPGIIRRLKRLSRLSLCLADKAQKKTGSENAPDVICFGTGWGSLSETSDFLDRLFETKERFPSPTDFIGSVHNAPAGQMALYLGATGPNIAVCGGDYSFEQALLSACLVMDKNSSALVMAADEGHEKLSPLFDPQSALDEKLSDGGGALWVTPDLRGGGPFIRQLFYEKAQDQEPDLEKQIQKLVHRVTGHGEMNESCGLIMAGMPSGCMDTAKAQLDSFLELSGFCGPIADIYKIFGRFASGSGVAAAIAAQIADSRIIPAALCHGPARALDGKRILILNLGACITAMDIGPS